METCIALFMDKSVKTRVETFASISTDTFWYKLLYALSFALLAGLLWIVPKQLLQIRKNTIAHCIPP
jgi:hypothetical protein